MRVEMKLAYKAILIFMGIAAVATCALPIMSVYLSDGESCTLFIRGYNLMEFSAWGCIPLIVPLLVMAILFGNQKKTAKEAELLLLFAGNMVCYVHSFNAAWAWLTSLDGSFITYHLGMFLLPLTFIMILALWKIFELLTYRGYSGIEDDDDALPF